MSGWLEALNFSIGCEKNPFLGFESNFSLNKNNLKLVAKMNVTPNTRGGANNGKLY